MFLVDIFYFTSRSLTPRTAYRIQDTKILIYTRGPLTTANKGFVKLRLSLLYNDYMIRWAMCVFSHNYSDSNRELAWTGRSLSVDLPSTCKSRVLYLASVIYTVIVVVLSERKYTVLR